MTETRYSITWKGIMFFRCLRSMEEDGMRLQDAWPRALAMQGVGVDPTGFAER
jgi:hypothetical protein